MSTVNSAAGARQSVSSPGTVTLPTAAWSGQKCWYSVSGASGLELAFNSGEDGILIEDGTSIVGPFRVASAPRFVVAGSADILVLVE